MAPAVESLEPTIRQILTAPGVDLAVISAKRVRKQLVELLPAVTPDYIRENKDAIDALIAQIYGEVSSGAAGEADAAGQNGAASEGSSSGGGGKRKRAEADEDDEDDAPKKPKKAKAKPKPKAKDSGGLTDEELARQLSNELNGRGARASRAAAPKKAAAKKSAKKGPKSSATVDSDGEGEEDEEEDEKPKKRRGGGFAKEYVLSEPLAAIVSAERLSRPQTVKQLWVYIKEHDLQNPENKKEIMCDDKFRALFKVDKIGMFKMNKELSQHFHEAPAAES